MKSTLSGILLLILLSFSAGAEDLERGGEAGIGRILEAFVTDLDSPDPAASVLRLTASEEEGDEAGVGEPVAAALVSGKQYEEDIVRPLQPQGRSSINSNAFHRHHSPSNSTSSTCGFCRTSLRLGDKGVVSSPRFPLPYGGGESCLWLLQTADGSRIRLTCDTIQLESCGPLGRDAPAWRDYLIVSPLWTFKKSWVYCGHATTVTSLKHTSICDKMAVAFRSNENGGGYKGFHCEFEAIE